jgi:hypothetical protein
MMCMVAVDLVCRPLTSWGRWEGAGVKARKDPIIFADGEGRGQRASRGLVVRIGLKCLLGLFLFLFLIRLL